MIVFLRPLAIRLGTLAEVSVAGCMFFALYVPAVAAVVAAAVQEAPAEVQVAAADADNFQVQ